MVPTCLLYFVSLRLWKMSSSHALVMRWSTSPGEWLLLGIAVSRTVQEPVPVLPMVAFVYLMFRIFASLQYLPTLQLLLSAEDIGSHLTSFPQ